MGKGKKCFVMLLCALPVAFLLVMVVAMFGNPVSHLLARHGARQYLEQEYPDTDYVIGAEGYNFKDGNYYAHVTSPSSVDTEFSIYMTGTGTIRYDTYDSVTSGWNTQMRLWREYDALIDEVFLDKGIGFLEDGSFGGEILVKDGEKTGSITEGAYGIEKSEIVVDKVYDMGDLGRRAGYISFHVRQEDITPRRAAEILLEIRERMDDAGVEFYAVDLVIMPYRNPDGTAVSDERINIAHFLCSDIYPEGLEARVEDAHKELTAYYEEQDRLNSEKYGL